VEVRKLAKKNEKEAGTGISEALRAFLRDGEDWDRKRTSIPGVSVTKVPATKNRGAYLAVEINPVDSTGNPIKRKGMLLNSISEAESLIKMLSVEGTKTLIAATMDVSGLRESKVTGEGVLEI